MCSGSCVKEAVPRDGLLCALRLGALLAGMVDGVIRVVLSGENELRDGNKGVALLEQSLQNGGQGLGGVKGGVVKQDNGPGLYLGGHPPGDLSGGQVLPVQAVTFPYRFQTYLD